jgi:CTP:molybdopterin cytidylyltransferase MocA
MPKAVDGVILAAGRSHRMNRPKPLLEVGHETFVQRAVRIVRAAGCRRTYIVLPAGAADIAVRMAAADIEAIANADPDSEQVDSLRLALRALPEDSGAALVLPVDLPLILETTAAALVRAWREKPGPLYLPFHNAVAGHPVLVDRSLYDEILDSELEEGLRTLIMNHTRDVREVRVTDPGILIDIDTPDDYWRYIEAK